MPDPREYFFTLPSAGRPSHVPLVDPWYPGVEPYWGTCTSKRSVDPIAGVVAVVIHATAGGSSSGAVSVMKAAKPASFHWLVPDEDEAQHGKLVWACVPETRAAWHVRNSASHRDVNGGATGCNHWSLGIEVVNTQIRDPFSNWQIEETAKIVRYCWAKYPNMRYVVSHSKLDPGRRSDPGVMFDWDRFRRLVIASPRSRGPSLVAGVTPLTKLRASTALPCFDGHEDEGARPKAARRSTAKRRSKAKKRR